MAVTQTVLTAWKTNQQIITIALQNGQAITGQVSDDGVGEDAIKVLSKGGQSTVVPKAVICTIPDPADVDTTANPPGKGTNQMRLI